MARPRKASSTLLHALLRARCSQAELAAVRARARRAGMTVSQFVRHAINASADSATASSASEPGAAPQSPSAPNPVHALVIAVNRAGNLVNQQMPLAHVRGELPAELMAANQALERALMAIANHLDQ